jgi:uncharacterized protein
LNAVGDKIIVRSCKYDGREHRRWSAQLLKLDGPLIVLDAYFPESVVHSELGTIASGTHSLEYYWLDRWFNVFRFAHPDGGLRNFYCNVNMPPVIEDGTLTYVDLDLDILVAPDRSYQILDVEDFAISARFYDYPEDLKIRAQQAVDEIIRLIDSREFPFNEQ